MLNLQCLNPFKDLYSSSQETREQHGMAIGAGSGDPRTTGMAIGAGQKTHAHRVTLKNLGGVR